MSDTPCDHSYNTFSDVILISLLIAGVLQEGAWEGSLLNDTLIEWIHVLINLLQKESNTSLSRNGANY